MDGCKNVLLHYHVVRKKRTLRLFMFVMLSREEQRRGCQRVYFCEACGLPEIVNNFQDQRGKRVHFSRFSIGANHMLVLFTHGCPHCGRKRRMQVQVLGHPVKCVQCGSDFLPSEHYYTGPVLGQYVHLNWPRARLLVGSLLGQRWQTIAAQCWPGEDLYSASAGIPTLGKCWAGLDCIVLGLHWAGVMPV